VLPYAGRVTEEGSLGRGRSLASPQFAGDDGAASASVRHLLATVADPLVIARALREERLLASVVAVLDELDEAGGDKDSHMAVVSMLNASGEKGLLVFTGVDSMARWNPQARPVPSWGRDVARSALDDGASAVVLDVAGPQPLVLTGPALDVLADQLDLPRVAALVQAALAPLTADGWAEVEVFDARPMDAGVDVIVQVSAPSGGHPDGRLPADLARQAADVISARADIHRLVLGGLGVTAAP
jgi:hypothetical protein